MKTIRDIVRFITGAETREREAFIRQRCADIRRELDGWARDEARREQPAEAAFIQRHDARRKLARQ